MQGAFIADGSLSEWGRIAPFELDSQKLVRGNTWGGVEDLSGRVWLAWDSNALYFAASLRDDDFLGCPQGASPWNADAFMLALRFPSREQIASRVYYLVASAAGGRPEAAALVGSGGRFTLLDLPGLELGVLAGSAGALFEGAIAWRDLTGCDGAPDRLELNFEIRDVDEHGVMKSLSWAAGNGPAAPGSEPLAVAMLLDGSSRLEDMLGARPGFGGVEYINLVFLPVVVTDSGNNHVLDLGAEDFVVLEDGREQQIESLRFETRPITVGLLIDSSSSMEDHIEDAKRAAISFLDGLRSEDRCFVISFNHQIELLKHMDEEPAVAPQAIERIEAYGGTALWEALFFALSRMEYIEEKKVIVLLSDGRDESRGRSALYGRTITHQEVLESARRQATAIYPIAFRLTDNRAVSELGALARQTGGRLFTPGAADQLLQAYNDIVSELKSQYLITYITNNRNWDGRWRTIEVRIRDRNYNVRTRPGYYAPSR